MEAIILLAIIAAYVYLGHKLNRNPILWGFFGFGILAGPAMLILLLGGILFPNSLIMPEFWSLSIIAGFLLSLIIIGYLAYKNNAVLKNQ